MNKVLSWIKETFFTESEHDKRERLREEAGLPHPAFIEFIDGWTPEAIKKYRALGYIVLGSDIKIEIKDSIVY